MESACLNFIRENYRVISTQYRNNFLCHIATLYDCGILQANQVANIIKALPKRVPTATNGR